jgi:Ser/Thr protein kinase RdoA (MazF antagonist)
MLRNNLLQAGGTDLRDLGDFLANSYKNAAQAVEDEGLSRWPKRICHADWHPGNVLYQENRVVGVIDYDSARLLPPIVDIANGALQFAVIFGEDDVSNWPDYLDESRFRRFVRGYEEVSVLSQAELRVMPWLMIEALIAEAVLPIATTGTFGRVDGIPFLQMVHRKLNWMQAHVEGLIEAAAG